MLSLKFTLYTLRMALYYFGTTKKDPSAHVGLVNYSAKSLHPNGRTNFNSYYSYWINMFTCVILT